MVSGIFSERIEQYILVLLDRINRIYMILTYIFSAGG
jgi:hypothetical protein